MKMTEAEFKLIAEEAQRLQLTDSEIDSNTVLREEEREELKRYLREKREGDTIQ